jgi:hypothetical protein
MPKAKNVEEYIAVHRGGVAANPDCGTSHYNLAVGLMGQKKYNEAEKELHRLQPKPCRSLRTTWRDLPAAW